MASPCSLLKQTSWYQWYGWWRLKVEELHTGVWDLLGYEVVWVGEWIGPLDLWSPETSVVTHAEDLSPHVWYLGRGHTILTSRALMWCYACSWDVRGDLTLNSMAQIHTSVALLTSRDLAWSSGRLTCQHDSQISAVAHISWDVTYVSSVLQTLPVVSRNGWNAYWKRAPTDHFIRHQVTRLWRSAYESQFMGRNKEGVENKT